MSTKLNRVLNEIEKTEQKISAMQDKLKVLHKERIDLENLEMIDYLRKKKVSHKDLQRVIDGYHAEHGSSIPLKTELEENNADEK